MKITQEVRDFAAKQNQPSDQFLAADAAKALSPTGRGLGEGETPSTDADAPVLSEVEAGMAEMSEKFREKGGEIYLPAAE